MIKIGIVHDKKINHQKLLDFCTEPKLMGKIKKNKASSCPVKYNVNLYGIRLGQK